MAQEQAQILTESEYDNWFWIDIGNRSKLWKWAQRSKLPKQSQLPIYCLNKVSQVLCLKESIHLVHQVHPYQAPSTIWWESLSHYLLEMLTGTHESRQDLRVRVQFKGLARDTRESRESESTSPKDWISSITTPYVPHYTEKAAVFSNWSLYRVWPERHLAEWSPGLHIN